MSNLSTLPKGDSAWLLRKAIERIIDQVSVLETNIGVSTSGNSANTQIIFNDDGTLRGDAGLVFDKTTDKLTIAGNVQAASATITGNLTVQTNALFVNSANNRVGIGTASPNWPLSIVGSSPEFVMLDSGANGSRFYTKATNTAIFIGASYSTSSVPINFTLDGGSSNAMTLNATGLGVGVSPAYKLHVIENASNVVARFAGSNSNGSVIQFVNTAAGGRAYTIGSNFTIGGAGEFAIYDSTAAATRLLIDSSGNVGIGVTPSGWNAAFRGLDISTGGAIAGSSDSVRLFANSAYNTAGNNVYKNTGAAARFDVQGNAYTWNQAASGTAGNAITFTQAMTLDASGNLLVGVASANANGGVLQLKSGITFPATQVASSDVNTLDDYEEGTFTPTIVGTSTAGTGTYTTQAGRYTKIGNRVFCEMFIAWTAHTGTGNMDINTNLPFTSNSSVFYSAASIGDTSGITLTASNTLGAVIVANSTLIRFRQMPVGGGNSNPVPIDTAGDVTLSISYIV